MKRRPLLSRVWKIKGHFWSPSDPIPFKWPDGYYVSELICQDKKEHLEHGWFVLADCCLAQQHLSLSHTWPDSISSARQGRDTLKTVFCISLHFFLVFYDDKCFTNYGRRLVRFLWWRCCGFTIVIKASWLRRPLPSSGFKVKEKEKAIWEKTFSIVRTEWLSWQPCYQQ